MFEGKGKDKDDWEKDIEHTHSMEIVVFFLYDKNIK